MQRQEYTNLGLDVELRSTNKTLDMGAQGIYQGTVQSSQEQYFGLPELYIGEARSNGAGFRLTVGRQKRHWSYFDEEFGMGIWQPQLRWDYLDPIQQGLTGLFVDVDLGHSLALTFFTSSVFLPDQGPNFQLVDGQFQSENRWFWAPRTNVLFGRSESQMSYVLDRPSTNDVVFQPSVGGQMRFQQQGSPFWAQASYAYMPMNQMHLAFDCPQCTDLVSMNVEATIHPMVLRHRVATLETGLEDDQQKGWLSATLDVPDSPSGPAQWIQSSTNQVLFVGGSYQHFLPLFNHPGWLKASYLKAIQTSQTPANILGQQWEESSLDRYPYQEVSAVEWNWLLLQRATSQLSWRTRYTYSFPDQGGWLSTQVWLSQKKWTWNLGIDLLGSSIDPYSANAGLFSRYRENGRATGGLSYAF